MHGSETNGLSNAEPAEQFPPRKLFLDGRLCEGARMFPFLGELIELVVLLFQRAYRCLQIAVGAMPFELDEQTIAILQQANSRNSIWPALAAHRLANGPPWDWYAVLFGNPVGSAQLVTASIPSRRFRRD